MKKQKLLKVVCSTAALLGMSSITLGVAFAMLNKDSKHVYDYVVTFDAGNGRFVNQTYQTQHVYSGETLDRIPQPEVIANQKDPITGDRYKFAGWHDGHNFVTGKHTFTKDTKLTAVYVNGATEGFHTVTFKSDDPTITFLGNRTVSVVHGERFYRVNRPVAQSADAKWFKHWRIQGTSEPIDENFQITGDIVLEPVMTIGVTITWDPNAEEGGKIIQGNSTTTLETGTVFSKFNQPQIQNEFYTVRFFAGWEYNDGSKWVEMKPTDVISQNITVRAKWSGSPEVSDGYATLAYVQNSDEGQPAGMSFTPSSFYIVQTKAKSGQTGFVAKTWADIVKPTVKTTVGNYKVATDEDGNEIWYVREIYPSGTEGEWIKLDNTYSFDKTEGSGEDIKYVTRYEIKPEMVSKITGIDVIKSRSEMLPETEYEFRASVVGGDEAGGQDVTWHVYSDPECTQELTEKGGSSIYFDGSYLHVDFMDANATYYVRAISSANTSIMSDPQPLKVVMPYEWSEVSSETSYLRYDQQIWFVNKKDGKNHWWRVDPAQLCDASTTTDGYEVYSITGDKDIISRYCITTPSFKSDLILGKAITALPEYFCAYFTNFAGKVVLPEKLESIGPCFMFGCENFDSQLTIPSTVTYIADHFMYGCSKFNNGSKGETVNTFDLSGLTGLTHIGDKFLGSCTLFDSPLTLPDAAYDIGMGFLADCVLFNRDITIPANITRVLSNFMNNCCSYTSTISIETPIDNFLKSDNNFSASAASFTYTDAEGTVHTQDCPINLIGFKFAGASGDDFSQMYPEEHEGTTWRKTNWTPVHIEDETTWNTAIAEIFTSATPRFKLARSASTVYETQGEEPSHSIDPSETYSFVTDTTETDGNTAYRIVGGHGDTRYAIYDPVAKAYISVDADKNVTGLVTDEDPLSVLRQEVYTRYVKDYGKWDATRAFNETTGEYTLDTCETEDEGNYITINGYLRFTEDDSHKIHIKTLRLVATVRDGQDTWTWRDTTTTTYAFSNIGTENYTGAKKISDVGRRDVMSSSSETEYTSATHGVNEQHFYVGALAEFATAGQTYDTLTVKLTPAAGFTVNPMCNVQLLSSDGTPKGMGFANQFKRVKGEPEYYEISFILPSMIGETIASKDIIVIQIDGKDSVVSNCVLSFTLSNQA